MLVRTDFKTEKEYDPMVKGADCFAVVENSGVLIMDVGYGNYDSFYMSRISGGQIEDTEPLVFVGENGISVSVTSVVWGGAKALILTADGNVCFADFSKNNDCDEG